jgi:hypothetical protein
MHSHELVELAAIISVNGPVLVQNVERIAENGLEQYWTTSKVRLDRWCRSLKNYSTQATDAKWRQCHWPRIQGIIEEILSSEMLTRVWTAVLCAHDREHHLSEAEPIARSVMLGHLEARHRVLTLLVRGPIDPQSAGKLNQLRNSSERWTDLLVGYLAGMIDVAEFAIDPDRAKSFAADLHYESNHPHGRHTWALIQTSLRSSFRQGLSASTPNADLNLRIAAGILACFPAELFDSTGQFRSLWLMRIINSADDTQGMIDDLLKTAPRHPTTFSASIRQTPDRLRRDSY